MREQTIGEILREARVAKHLTLEEVEEKTIILPYGIEEKGSTK